MFFLKILSRALNIVEVTLMFSGYPLFLFLKCKQEVCFSAMIKLPIKKSLLLDMQFHVPVLSEPRDGDYPVPPISVL